MSFVIGNVIRLLPSYIPLMHRWKYSFSFAKEKELIIRTATLMLPMMIGSVAGEINRIIDKTLASQLTAGSISALAYSGKLRQVVISLFVVSILTVVYPKISEHLIKNEKEKLQKTMTYSMNLIQLISIPVVVGLIVLGQDFVTVFFKRGAFTQENVIMTSTALTFYSIGILGRSVGMFTDKVYFSLNDTKTPMKAGFFSIALNIVLNLALVGPMKHNGLALATSIAAIAAGTYKFLYLRKKNIAVEYRRLFKTFLKVSISSLVMGGVVFIMSRVFVDVETGVTIVRFGKLVFMIVTGVGVYAVGLLVLQVEAFKEIITKIIVK